MNKKSIQLLLNDIEEKYQRCWETLAMLKEYPKEKRRIDEIFDFQPLLCEALIDLEKPYHTLCQEEKRLVERKHKFSPTWFKARMKALAHYKRAIQETSAIGRSLGDAFAWLFYANEQALLVEHAKHQRMLHMPVGTGGIGELEFIRNVKVIEGKFLLYHGTTTILRHGDMSFIDLKTLKVAAIGELKSKKISSREFSFHMEYIGKADLLEKRPKTARINRPSQRQQLSPACQDRLNRQMEGIGELFVSKNPLPSAGRKNFLSNPLARDFEKLVQQAKVSKFSNKILGEGLLLSAYRKKKGSLYSRIFETERSKISDKISDVTRQAIHITAPDSPHNSLRISSFHYSRTPAPNAVLGMLPFFWWSIDLYVIKKVVFREVDVISIYNPLHLIRKLEAVGFSVTPGSAREEFVVETKPEHGEIMTIEGFSYFLNLVQHCLYKEETIIELLSSILFEVKKKNLRPNARVDLRFFSPLGSMSGQVGI